ncbi:uncharacterized protein LOC134088547 isoform X2 [Sardina pilchardus]|uniref:uncharacterized protein LOC134088547 isoform X2 n=1 Tax=Sardina pilchardus TaxID=27697 RepID=UPI002E1244BC
MVLRKQWKDEDMVQAMEEVAGGMPVRQACKVFNVPRNTLMDRVSGRVTHGRRSGPSNKLSVEDEQALVEYCQYCAYHGFPLTKARLQAYATVVWRNRTKQPALPPLSHRWWTCFKKRHAAVLSLALENIGQVRSTCAKPEPVIRFFDLLEKTMNEHGLRNKPAQVYNCDKTEFNMEKSRSQMVAQRETKHPRVSVLACFNAAGEDIPPLIIFPKSFPGGQYTTGGPPDAIYGKTPEEYVDSKLFLRWFHHFLLHARQERPLVLIFDGHKAHPSPPVVEAAIRAGVVLLHLPSYTSHVLQPLEVGFFGSLKVDFATVADNLCHLKHSYIVNRTEFAKIVHHPYQQAKANGVVVRGFKKCGIFPLDRTVIKSRHPTCSRTTATTTSGPSPSSSVGTSASPPPIGSSQTPDSQPSLSQVLVEAELISPITAEEYEKFLQQKEQQSAGAREAEKQRDRANNFALQTTDPVATSRRGRSARTLACASSPSSSNPSAATSSAKKRKAAVLTQGQKRNKKSAGGDKKTPKATVQRKQWKDEDMVQAMEEVARGMPVRQACKVFNVPRNTLMDRVSGRVTHGRREGPSNKLSVEDEQALVEYCQYCADHGFPLTRAQVLAYATAVWRKRTKRPESPPLSTTWWAFFKKRHTGVLSITCRKKRPTTAAATTTGPYPSSPVRTSATPPPIGSLQTPDSQPSLS